MSDETLRVLLYSSDRTVREQMRLALGYGVASDLPPIEVGEMATGQAMLKLLGADPDFNLLILDSEAQSEGGIGLAHQVREEYDPCPSVLPLVARVANTWLGTWSRAEAISAYPVGPVRLPTQAAGLLREKVA